MTNWIVGLDNPHSRDPDKALEPHDPISAGGRLFKMSRMKMDDYLDAFRRVNVIDRPHPFLEGDRVIVLGREAWRRLRFPQVEWWRTAERGGVMYFLAPHPSGRSRTYNTERGRDLLAALLQTMAGVENGYS